jgi:hypothetical protein
MKISYLDFYKLLLEKVSFDSYLLTKEYRKAVRDLSEKEKEELSKWLHEIGLASRIERY